MSIDMSTPEDPTAAMRQARHEARVAALTRDEVVETWVQLLRDTVYDETNALTRALADVLSNPPEDRWELDGLLRWLPSRYKADVGGAVLRLLGEAILHRFEAEEQPF